MNDISLKDFSNLGSFDFKGELNGNGYFIANYTSNNGALFNNVTDATFKNLGIKNFNITHSKLMAFSGIFANYATNTVFQNIYLGDSSMDASGPQMWSGALVGTTIDSSLNNVMVKNISFIKSEGGGYGFTGGLIGAAAGITTVVDASVLDVDFGTHTSSNNFGAIVGAASTTETSTLSLQNIFTNATSNIKDLVAYTNENATVITEGVRYYTDGSFTSSYSGTERYTTETGFKNDYNALSNYSALQSMLGTKFDTYTPEYNSGSLIHEYQVDGAPGAVHVSDEQAIADGYTVVKTAQEFLDAINSSDSSKK